MHTVLAAVRALMSEAEAARPLRSKVVHRRYVTSASSSGAVPHAQRAAFAASAQQDFRMAGTCRQRLAQRQKVLHDWLSWVVCQPALICDELRLFLGLSPLLQSK